MSHNCSYYKISISGRGSSEKVGRWAIVEGEESAEGAKPLPSFGVTPGKCFENIAAIWCTLETSGHQKWDGQYTLFRPTFKSGTEFTVPAVQVLRPLPPIQRHNLPFTGRKTTSMHCIAFDCICRSFHQCHHQCRQHATNP